MSDRGKRFFFYKTSRSAGGPAYGYRLILLLWVRRLEPEEPCPPSCVRVNNERKLPLVPVYAFMAWSGIAQSVKWLDCNTVVRYSAVVLVSVAISLGLRRIERAAEHSVVVSRLGRVVTSLTLKRTFTYVR